MPSGNYNASRRPQTQGFNVGPAIDSFAAAKHLFHDDENASPKDVDRMSTPDIKGIISMTEPDDKFPTLSRRTGSNIVSNFMSFSLNLDSLNSQLSANPDAHDLASRRTPGPQSHSFHTRHRSTHQSMPQNVGEMRLDQVNSAAKNDHGDMAKARELLRRSLEATFVLPDRDAEAMTPVPANRPAAVQSSYSTNDLPTVSHSGHNSISHSGHNSITSPQSQAEHLHSHNPSIGSISTSAASRPASMESSGFDALSNIQSTQTPLQGSVASYGPYPTSVAAPPYTTSVAAPAGNLTAATTLPFPVPIYPYSFAVQPFTGQPVHTVTNNQLPSFPAANTYGDYNYGSGYRFNENRYNENRYNGNRHNENRHNENRYNENRYSDHRYNENPGRSNVGQRRHTHTEGDVIHPTRYANYPVAHYRGDLYTMCKDQHGCRYLQRKLEERDPEDVQMIFSETYMHVIELMTGMVPSYFIIEIALLTLSLDPFGNYLCQKLFEYATTEQRTVLVNHAAPQLVPIALNQHGTRALQKMIEFITTPEQTWTVIRALDGHVVDLVQDLNGNHVIQKCLNSFHDGDADFILEAVGSNCVRVGTHRHGCCVIQRCLDHSSGPQRVRLVGQITDNAFPLVQDPFGNYVMQYILDLKDMRFIHPIIDLFKGQIAALSKHKFSSNVIEKLLRNSDGPSARAVIDEMLVGNELERMLRDSYANYVVQTAMDVADQTTRRRIIDIIRPILPSMRQTPHGRRIAGKILNADPSGRNHHGHNGMRTSPQLPKGALQRPIVFSRPSSSYGPRHALPPTPAMSSSNTPPGGSYTSTPPAGYNTTPPSGVDGGSSPEGEDAARALFGGSAAGRGDQRYSYF